ncbi:MAG: hypothetical protein V3U29_05430 [Phycisphaeraceae bacterium]
MFGLGFADEPATGESRPAAPVPSPRPDHDTKKPSVPDEANTIVTAFMPWVVSLLVHAGVVLLAIFLVWSTIDRPDERVIIPIAHLSRTPPPPLTMQRTEPMTRTTASRHRRVSRVTQRSPALLTSKADMQTIGVEGGGADTASPFDTAVQSGATGNIGFFGVRGGNARTIAYVVDASGSLIDTLPDVIKELTRSINRLDERQRFTIIFFQANAALEVPVPKRGLKRATAQNKQKVIKWIDQSSHNIVPEGASSPIKALQLALKYKPDLIYILSDNITGAGRYEVDQRRLLAEIDKANTARTRINTIQFIYPDKLAEQGLKPTLQLISERTGGTYKFVDGKERGRN